MLYIVGEKNKGVVFFLYIDPRINFKILGLAFTKPFMYIQYNPSGRAVLLTNKQIN